MTETPPPPRRFKEQNLAGEWVDPAYLGWFDIVEYNDTDRPAVRLTTGQVVRFDPAVVLWDVTEVGNEQLVWVDEMPVWVRDEISADAAMYEAADAVEAAGRRRREGRPDDE